MANCTKGMRRVDRVYKRITKEPIPSWVRF
jgi:hypothetical protein